MAFNRKFRRPCLIERELHTSVLMSTEYFSTASKAAAQGIFLDLLPLSVSQLTLLSAI